MAYSPVSPVATANEAAAGIFAQVAGYGALRVTEEGRSIFYDPFDTALDTTNTWVTPNQVSGATVVQGTGGLTISSGTTASARGDLVSQPTFVGRVPAFAQVGFALKLEAVASSTTPYGTGANRFWGVGTTASSPTAAAPLTDAVGWEIDYSTGNLQAVVYASGVRTVVSNLTAAGYGQTDGGYHRYAMFMRTDKCFWYLDSLDTPIATSSFVFSTVQSLPLRLHAYNFTTPPASTRQVICTGVAVGDMGNNTTQVSDGTYPWRKAAVSASGGLSVAMSQANAVSTLNSTTAQLAASATFTGTWEDVLGYGEVTVLAYSDQASAANGLVFQWSTNNGTTTDDTEGFSVPASNGYTFSLPPEARYFRLVYTNGAGGTTTTLKIQVIYKVNAPLMSLARSRQTMPAAAHSDGQRVGVFSDQVGRLVVAHNSPRALVVKNSGTLTTTGATTLLAASGTALVFVDLTLLLLTNTSATATTAVISDGTATFTVALAANGGAVIPFNTPQPATTANTAWTITLGTAVTSVDFMAQGIKTV